MSHDEDGMVTSEWAITGPPAILGLLLGLTAILASFNVVSVANAAKEVARQVAIQGTADGVAETAHRIAGEESLVSVSIDGDFAEVLVTKEGTGLFGLLGIDFEASHRAAIEPGGDHGTS